MTLVKLSQEVGTSGELGEPAAGLEHKVLSGDRPEARDPG